MQIRLRYFASLRETVGKNEEMLTVPENITVAEVRTLLLERYPGLEKVLRRAVGAINRQYVPPETILKDDDEVVFIPPVGGGCSCQSAKVRFPWNH
ncbi:MAG TPA: molybdopterin converting factor subunit 1 [Ktedonobacteraceae bacterium]|nr:molybdopterin converting factor subunit 1 [Ktedonobacteraceae bacterium]